jgi:hypothetical protein
MPIQRFSSRQHRLDESFLTPRLAGALRYDRIAGYFRSSIFEVAGEQLESVRGIARVICNSDLRPEDVQTARAAEAAMRNEWCAGEPEKLGAPSQKRFKRLYQFLVSGKLQVKVLPNEYFGLIHGKAGVITLADGRQTAFLGSVNESLTAWRVNYELIWEDDSPEAIAWVQAEFDALWASPHAVPLAHFVVEDIERITRRQVIDTVDEWREQPVMAAPIIESPVYRQQAGLWEHQKYFVRLAFDAHRGPHGARFILADQVGLGKTLQLGMAAELMALSGDKPVLILAPKALVWQWRDELRNMLDIPSAVWNGRQWVDENDIEYPNLGPLAIQKCPRWIGIISTGLITRASDIVDWLATVKFECVILDEAHRARRKNLMPGQDAGRARAEPNNLLAFMQRIAHNTKSLLLATATPVQLAPVEAWDLLDVLNRGNDSVLGVSGSLWRDPERALGIVMGQRDHPTDEMDMWEWLRNPFPPASEDRDYAILRRSLNLSDADIFARGASHENLNTADRARIRRIFPDLIRQHNPFIRHVIRRTRQYLETTTNPETSEPYLKPVRVRLHGDRDQDAIALPLFLKDAYQKAENFCNLVAQRANAGFLKTLLLRRVGSTIEAGKITAKRMLGTWQDLDEGGEVADDEGGMYTDDQANDDMRSKQLSPQERQALESFLKALEANQEPDPKYAVIDRLLRDRGWIRLGCIIFSQYFDSVWWLAGQLSKDWPNEQMAIYAGMQKSGLMQGGHFTPTDRDQIKALVQSGKIRLVLGTDAASEGLNLQRLGTLINLDLPWNPSRLEQRKGRIQRIGQWRDEVDIYNLRYAGSVEDRVHQLLSERSEDISNLFGQLPDIIEDAWIDVAVGEIEKAKQTIDAVPRKHPFEIRYHTIEHVDWESCATVLNSADRKQFLSRGWK